MKDVRTQGASSGIGLPGALFIVFVVLKLVGVIDWSWAWVCSPLWIPIAFVLAVAFLIGVGMLVRKLFSNGG
jgi:hypothetical protein